MDDGAHYKRAQVLVDRHRPKDAEQELLKHLAGHPQDPWAHSLMATTLNMQQKRDFAVQAAKQAIELAPNEGWFHYVLADVHYGARRFAESRRCVDEALRLDPHVPRYWGLKANLEGADGNWKAVLEAAEAGLTVDATHAHCKNLRALALAKLGKKDAAKAAFSENLANNPENALTFAYQGWTHIHNGEAQEAITSFSEALRLQPALDWARVGMMAALRDRHWMFVWARRLSKPWAVPLVVILFIGSVVATMFACIGAKENPLLLPIAALAIAVTVTSGFAFGLSCLPLERMNDDQLKMIMLFDSRGQFLLTEQERKKAWISTAFTPIGLFIGGWMGYMRSHHEGDEAFLVFVGWIVGFIYLMLGVKFFLSSDADMKRRVLAQMIIAMIFLMPSITIGVLFWLGVKWLEVPIAIVIVGFAGWGSMNRGALRQGAARMRNAIVDWVYKAWPV